MTATRLLVLATAFVAASASAQETPPATTIDMAKFTCKELMAGNDSDRDAGMAYYHGYFAGRKNDPIIDGPRVTGITNRVNDYCLSNPTSTVMDAFTKAM